MSFKNVKLRNSIMGFHMNKTYKTILIAISLIIVAVFSYSLRSSNVDVENACSQDADIYFFFSETCSVCAKANIFLNDLEERYPNFNIAKCNIAEKNSVELLLLFYAEYNVPRDDYGTVPTIFFTDKYFIGFGDAYAKEIENRIKALGEPDDILVENIEQEPEKDTINIPIIGQVSADQYSLPVMAIVLGFFDGFNVCSLGALVMILGLILVLKNRKRILLFGGVFIITTTLIYGLLIVLWYNLFIFLSPYLKAMEVFIGVIGIAGGIYFLKDFIRFKKQGPTCEMNTGQSLMTKFSAKIQDSLENKTSIIAIVLSILLFTVVITVAEFPCSAAVPLFFAGRLAVEGMSTFGYLSYIGLFILFYMIDEIVIFLIAVFTMTIKLASKKFIIWITLVEAIVLFALGLYYLFGFLIFR